MRFQEFNVTDRAGRQIVDDVHVVASKETGIREVGPEEAGASGDQDVHV